MNRSETEGKSGSHSTVSSTTTTRLAGFWLIVARAAWFVLVVPSLGLFVVGLPVYDQQLQRAQTCGPADCLFGGLTTTDLQTLSAHGIPVSGYAAVFSVFFVLTAVVWLMVGFLLFWRRSDDSIAVVSLEDLVPSNHFFRHLERTLDLSFVRAFVQETYAGGGRPSIDPVVFFKLQLVMFFEGIRAARQLMRHAADRLSILWY